MHDTPGTVGPLEPVIAAIRARGPALRAIPGVLGARPGFRAGGGEGAPGLALIVVTRPGEPVGQVPAEVDGIPVETRPATPQEVLEGLLPLSVWEGVIPEAAPQIGYRPPDPAVVALREMEVRDVTCHVGPDSGWSTLEPFLAGTTRTLTVAMFEFYARHIIDTVARLGEETDASLNMILQVDANDRTLEPELRQSWGDRLELTPASVSGPDRIFNNSYHTKVAVRDSSAFWLSSGNWSPNSQPALGASAEHVWYSKGNREWHVIVEDEPLAQMYEKFIEHDIAQAQEVAAPEAAVVRPDLLVPASWLLEPEAAVVQDHPFLPQTFATAGPVRVRPLMSPDNYAAGVLELIRQAERTLYLQFSYIRQPSREIFDEIIDAIAEKMDDDAVDVRVLVSTSQNAEHSDLLVASRGWKRDKFRRQRSKMHNKGILVDGKIAVVGSNNWSTDGTQYNRDTSLVFFSPPITQYFTEVFLFDWDNLSSPIGGAPEAVPILAPEAGPTPPGMVRIPWQAWYDE